MITPLAATSTIHLFGPLLIGAVLSLVIFVVGRIVATRKITRALDDEDGSFDLPEADAPVVSFRRAQGSGHGVSASFESEHTHEFIRARAPKRSVCDDCDEITQRFQRA